MSAPKKSSSPAASEEAAALWAARLDAGQPLSAADRRDLETWLAGDARHPALLSEFCQLSVYLEKHTPALAAIPATAPRTPASRGSRSRWFAGAALAAAAALAVVLWLAPARSSVENIATAVAQRQVHTLADGTRVELNAQTTLLVENGRAERRVRLAGGEAFFAVSVDRTRPFIVETPAGSVRVTGTAFNVRTDTAAQLLVTVVEGSVQVSPGEISGAAPAAPVALAAGDQLSAENGVTRVKALPADALENALAWRQGQIVFEGVRLDEALARFARYHGRGINAAADAAALKVGGRYSLDDLDGFFASLEAVLPVEVTRGMSGTVRVNLRPAR
jgi:transmembrane sensor